MAKEIHENRLARTIAKIYQPFVKKTSQAFSGEQLFCGELECMGFVYFRIEYRSIEVPDLCLKKKKKE
jgi:hypothetical protein